MLALLFLSFFSKALVLLLSHHPPSDVPELSLLSASLPVLSSTTDNGFTRLDRLGAVNDVGIDFRLVGDALGDGGERGELGRRLKTDAAKSPREGVPTSGVWTAVTLGLPTDTDGE